MPPLETRGLPKVDKPMGAGRTSDERMMRALRATVAPGIEMRRIAIDKDGKAIVVAGKSLKSPQDGGGRSTIDSPRTCYRESANLVPSDYNITIATLSEAGRFPSVSPRDSPGVLIRRGTVAQ